MPLSVVLSNTAGIPIYEQIKRQIKEAILTDRVAVDERHPSIRVLARDLRVSVITTTRAYSDLTAEGFVANVPGKGYFVLPRDAGLVHEQVLREVEGGGTIADIAHALTLSQGTVRNHVSSAMLKMDARTRAEAASLARSAGWL